MHEEHARFAPMNYTVPWYFIDAGLIVVLECLGGEAIVESRKRGVY